MILRAKKYVAVLLVFVCVCMIFSPLTAYAAEDSSQHETVKVGFFAMDGYHVMDEEGNRSGYGYMIRAGMICSRCLKMARLTW